jgi:hypothetical protein
VSKHATAGTLILALAFGCFAFAQASQSPYVVKQDVLGESLAQYQANNPKDCPTIAFKTHKHRGVVFCTVAGPAIYAEQTVNKKTVGFIHDRLYFIEMDLPHASYRSVTAALANKFGEPEEQYIQRSVYINLAEAISGMAMSHVERLNVPEIGVDKTWKNGVSTIDAQEYNARDAHFQTSTLTFTLDVLAKEAAEKARVKSKTDM